MKHSFRAVLVVSVFLFSFFTRVHAASNVLIYGNGMNNSAEQAALSLAELRSTVSSEQKFTEAYVMYNHDEKWWAQVWEVVKQKFGERPAAMMFDSLNENLLADVDVQNLFMQSFEPNLLAEVDEDLLSHLSFYRRLFARDATAIVVSHSQGCFYANKAFETLRNEFSNIQNRFKNIQVASPSSRVSSGGPWVTLSGDIIINSVRASTSALPANYRGPGNRRADFWGHSFVESYLAQSSTKAAILGHVLAVSKEFSN